MRFDPGSEDGTAEKLLADAQKQADADGKIDWVASIDSTTGSIMIRSDDSVAPRETGGSLCSFRQ